MPKPHKAPPPATREEAWKKLWATPRPLDDKAMEAVIDEFETEFIPSHMRKRFSKTFETPRAAFGNRYFMDSATYHPWNVKFADLGVTDVSQIEVFVVFAAVGGLEGFALRGQPIRSLRDVVLDDRVAACAIVRAGAYNLYLFVEPKMRGCVVRIVHPDRASEE